MQDPGVPEGSALTTVVLVFTAAVILGWVRMSVALSKFKKAME